MTKLCDDQYTYDPDVVEFLSTIMYLGLKSTFSFLGGSMFYGQVRMFEGNRDFSKIRMNLGGPSESLCQKQNTDFTCKLSILKCLSLLQLKVSNHNPEEVPTHLASNSKLLVYPCCYSNDGTALKPAFEFDPVVKKDVGLTVPVDLDPLDPQLVKELIVTEAVVGSITSLYDKISLPVSVEYTPKARKKDQSLEMFTKHVKTLQICESCTEDSKPNHLITEGNQMCD